MGAPQTTAGATPTRVLVIDGDDGNEVRLRDLLADLAADEPLEVEWLGLDAGRAALAAGGHDVCLVAARQAGALLRETPVAGWDTPVVVLADVRERGADRALLRAGAAFVVARAELESGLLDCALHAAAAQRRRQAALARQLEAANRELQAFTYHVSHDLRAPLRAVSGFAEAIEEDAGAALPAEARGHLTHLRAAAARMRGLIDGLLRLAQAGRVEVYRSEVDISALAEEVTAALRRAAPQRRVDVTIAPGLRASGDVQLLRTVLEELLGNAWKFTGRHPDAHIAVGVAAPGGEPVFFVRDDGAGFDPEYRDKLFQPFQRLHSRDDFDGSGVGLATVQRIIQRHGGRIWAEGAVEGGATFHFTLPD